MYKPELLAPAGNMEKLKISLHYGADAVYLGGHSFGLRNMADNFSIEEMGLALDLCHRQGVKAYLTINSYPRNEAMRELEAYLKSIAPLPFDAYIVADPGVIEMVRGSLPTVSCTFPPRQIPLICTAPVSGSARASAASTWPAR